MLGVRHDVTKGGVGNKTIIHYLWCARSDLQKGVTGLLPSMFLVGNKIKHINNNLN